MKKIIISTTALRPILHKLGLIILKNPTVPALSNIFCKVTKGSIEFIVSDLEITMLYRCECETTGDAFDFLIPFQLLSQVVSLNKDMPLSFTLDEKGVKITGENDSYDVKALIPVTEYPKLPTLPKKNSMQVDSVLIKWLGTALETIGKDEANKAKFTYVLLELRTNETTVASSDGAFYLFSYTLPMPAPADEELLISAKTIKVLEGMTDAKLTWTEKHYAFESKDLTLIITKCEYKYVDFRAVVPQGFDSNMQIDKHALVSALEKCSINTDGFKDSTMNLKKKGKTTFRSQDKMFGINIQVDVVSEYTGKVEEFRVSADKMLKVIHQVHFPTIELAIHDPKKAIVFRSPEDPAYLGLLWPLMPEAK